MKNRRNKERLIAKRNSPRLDLNWGPRLLEGAFGDAYRRYRIDGIPSMDPDTFLNRIRRFLIDLLKKESRMGAVKVSNNNMDQIQEGSRIGWAIL